MVNWGRKNKLRNRKSVNRMHKNKVKCEGNRKKWIGFI